MESTYAETCGPRIKLLSIGQNNELNRMLNGYLNASGWTQRLPAGEKVGEKEVAEGEERMDDWEEKSNKETKEQVAAERRSRQGGGVQRKGRRRQSLHLTELTNTFHSCGRSAVCVCVSASVYVSECVAKGRMGGGQNGAVWFS